MKGRMIKMPNKGRLVIKRGSKGLAIVLAIIVGLICLGSVITGVLYRNYYYLAKKEKIRNPAKFKEYSKKEDMFLYICFGLAIFGTIIMPLMCYIYFYV